MIVKTHHFNLEMEHPFGISRSVHSFQETFIVELSMDGKSGFGEATQNSYYGFTLQNMQEKLNELQSEIENYSFTTPTDFWNHLLYPNLKDFRFLMAAIDEAANDLYGKLQGKPLYKLWNFDISSIPMTTYTIGIDTIEVMQKKLLDKPWPIYKIKLGTQHDIEIIKALRSVTDAPFRIDANTGWTADETIKNSFILKDLGVEFIEQPMAYDQWEAMKYVKKHSVLPVIADESIRTEEDVKKCAESFDGINVKLVKAGGITPAKKMLKEALDLGISTMIGCMTESSVGISAAAQLLPLCKYADLDGAILLKNDIAKGVKVDNGKIILNKEAGSGVSLL